MDLQHVLCALQGKKCRLVILYYTGSLGCGRLFCRARALMRVGSHNTNVLLALGSYECGYETVFRLRKTDSRPFFPRGNSNSRRDQGRVESKAVLMAGEYD